MMDPTELIKSALDFYKPSGITIAVSGGKDSTAVLKTSLATCVETGLPLLVYAIDTKLSADYWRDYIKSLEIYFGIKISILSPTDKEWDRYLGSLTKFGHPYTPGAHKWVFNWLKRPSMRRASYSLGSGRNARVLNLDGVRRAESYARRDAAPIVRDGSRVHVRPILNFSDDDVAKVLTDVPVNPYYHGNSGDCQCNWVKMVTWDNLETYSPCLAKRIRELDKIAVDAGKPGWAKKPNKIEGGSQPKLKFQDFDFCASCDAKPILYKKSEQEGF